jgi:ATP-dependent helicase Lhr and Lhr-like helicase
MSLSHFHPAVAQWFEATFSAATPPQLDAWPAIQSGEHVLIAAPTGSGKTLAAFLSAIDSLIQQGVKAQLQEAVQVVYVSPLKALSNDVQRNLQLPLAGINEQLQQLGLPDVKIYAEVRTGDTPQSTRAMMRKHPPHILVTTPESLYLLLTSDSGREMLASTRTVIVDEIHAVAATKRGAHLALSLERLTTLCQHPLQRIGLSATQKPIEDVAKFLVGCGTTSDSLLCKIVDSGHVRQRDLALLMPDAPLEAVMSGEVWNNVYDKLATLVETHHTTLIFTNTRRMVERVTRHLSERIGEEHIAAHHGSLSKELRFDAEQRLKQGKLKVMVATASLELGIDIGDVELVVQLSSPRSIATFLQRVGRANHSVGGVPKGRIVPTSRDDLVECTALLAAVRLGELDRLIFQPQPVDVLCQQLVAEVSAREYDLTELYSRVIRAWPYRELSREQFDTIITMLSDGFATRRGRQSAYLHRDAVNQRVSARRGAKLTAITCGGAIPDNADYHVVLEPQGTLVGTLNEDFAIESNAGDIFQLGNSSYRILRVEGGRVRVEDAHGQPPTIPFWLGEAPARTNELSNAVSRLRSELNENLATINSDTLNAETQRLMSTHGLETSAAQQIIDYLGSAKAVLGELPTQQTLLLERFFDETGGMQLVIHSPFGGRINRAFGLALRKRFCRSFNFELQAAATEDAIILSLGETHSFVLADVARYLNSNTVKDVLVQALLDAPMFATRWRWNVSISLAIQRMRGGKRTPAAIQRIASEDLVSVIFPDQLACIENIQGERQIPDHPLVNQTLHDCLHEAMDIDGLITLLKAIESGEMKVIARDLPQPSPLAQEILNARPYAFLDDAPLEERRTQAVAARRWLDPQAAQEFGQLSPDAIKAVRDEAWPQAINADELHDAMMTLGLVTQDEVAQHRWQLLLDSLVTTKRATEIRVANHHYWVTAESLPMIRAIYTAGEIAPIITTPTSYQRNWERDAAIVELIRGRMQGIGPTTSSALVDCLGLSSRDVECALAKLETEGFVLRGQFTPNSSSVEWCERRLLARIHRCTLQSLRAEIEPVNSADCMRFLLEWHGITRSERAEGVQALASIIEQLDGYEVPAAAWESDVLSARMHEYDPNWLDSLCLSGRAMWLRLATPKSATAGPVRGTPIGLITRKQWPLLQTLVTSTQSDKSSLLLSHSATAMHEYLLQRGASFFDDIANGSKLLNAQAEDALGELVAAGCVTSDSFSGLRALIIPQDKKRRLAARGRRIALFGLEDAGRWSLVQRMSRNTDVEAMSNRLDTEINTEQVCWMLLRRYGVLCRRLLEREADWLPPWHVLLRALRRLEAQGHIRGGRFIAGVPGEHYALPEAVTALRAIRKRPLDDKLISLSAADPLNLVGTLLPGPRVPALASNRILLRDGVAIAVYVGGETQLLTQFEPQLEWEARNALLRPLPTSQVKPA